MLFQKVLDVAVNGQHKGVAVLRRNILLGIGRHIFILRILYTHNTSSRTGKHVVILGFQTICAIVIAADIAKHSRKERTLLVIPFGIWLGIHTCAARLLQLLI